SAARAATVTWVTSSPTVRAPPAYAIVSTPRHSHLPPVNDGMPHRALIFDCDGTLVDSERLGVEVLIEVAETCGAQFAHDVAPLNSTVARNVTSDEVFVEGLVVALRGLSMAQCLAQLEERGGFRFP